MKLNKKDFERIAEAYEQTKTAGNFFIANNHDDIEKAEEQTAKKCAFYSCDFVGGKYRGYFVACSPWYDMAFLIFDGETGRELASDLAIYYNAGNTTAQKIEKMYKKYNGLLFDPEEVRTTKPRTYAEYRNRAEFARNIYPRRFPYVSAWYIGEPNGEQKEAAKNGFYSEQTFGFYKTKEQAEEINRTAAESYARHKEQLDNVEYITAALKYEFYNFECMYGGRYAEAAAAVGIYTDKMTETQAKAYNAAYREFWKEVNAQGDY